MTAPRVTMYTARIRARLLLLRSPEVRPELVEAWMRLEYGTLDHLSGARWNRAVREALACVKLSDAHDNEQLARSYGLLPGDLCAS